MLENEIFDDRTDDRTSIEECAAGAQVLLNAVLEYDRRQPLITRVADRKSYCQSSGAHSPRPAPIDVFGAAVDDGVSPLGRRVEPVFDHKPRNLDRLIIGVAG